MHVEPIDGIGKSDYARYCELLGLAPDYNLTPRQRQAALPAWLTPELCATPPARAKVRTYGRRHLQPQPQPSTADVLVALHCIGGDEDATLALAQVLVEKIPAPVRDFAVERCTFIAIGARVAGFCGTSNLAAADGRSRPRLIVLSARESFDALIGHEIGHAWTLDEPEATRINGGTVWQSAFYSSDLSRVPSGFVGEAVARRRSYARDEGLAERLAARWGFGDVFEERSNE